MPVYEYRCVDCAKSFEKLVPLTGNGDSVDCPACGRRAIKQFSTFAALGVKAPGSGGCCGGGGACACAGQGASRLAHVPWIRPLANHEILRFLADLPESAAPQVALASVQVMAADAPFEPNPLVPLIVHGFGTDDAWARARDAMGQGLKPEQRVFLLRSEGAPGEATLGALLERPAVEALYIPAVEAESAERSVPGLRQLVHRLRAPGGCPWDREQTHESLVKYVIEEAYEVTDAIRHGGAGELVEELGDLLLQVFLQAELAEESGDFSLNDVVEQISKKLIRRHPHVFGDVEVSGAGEVEQNWERLKGEEKGERKSALDGLPRSQPALMAAQKIQKRLKRAGFDWPDRWGVDAKLDEELGELRSAKTPAEAADELGDVLFILSRLAFDLGADAEESLRGTNRRVEGRFRYVEERLAERGVGFKDVPLDESLALWAEAKATERHED